MEAEIDQTFGDVVDLDARCAFGAARVQDALVGDTPALASVKDRKVRMQPFGHVVRAENGHFTRALQTLRPHHRDVGPRDKEDARAAPGGGTDRADTQLPADGDDGMPRQELG